MSQAPAPQPGQGRDAAAAPPHVGAAAGLESASRRRGLLKGLGKAGAIAGAAMPLRSLATGDKPGMRLVKDGKTYLCTVSGNNSLTHASHAATGTTCSAKSVAYYRTTDTWPSSAGNTPVCPVGARLYTPSNRFNEVFGGGSSLTLQQLLGARVPTAEAHWVVALLNATKMAPSFPYSTTEVRALYNSPNAATRDAALSFFQNNLEG